MKERGNIYLAKFRLRILKFIHLLSTKKEFLRVHFTNPIVKLIIDKFLSQKKIEEYNEYLKRKLNNKIPFLKIEHESSINDPCLQVADFIVGAFFQKYEHKRTTPSGSSSSPGHEPFVLHHSTSPGCDPDNCKNGK